MKRLNERFNKQTPRLTDHPEWPAAAAEYTRLGIDAKEVLKILRDATRERQQWEDLYELRHAEAKQRDRLAHRKRAHIRRNPGISESELLKRGVASEETLEALKVPRRGMPGDRWLAKAAVALAPLFRSRGISNRQLPAKILFALRIAGHQDRATAAKVNHAIRDNRAAIRTRASLLALAARPTPSRAKTGRGRESGTTRRRRRPRT